MGLLDYAFCRILQFVSHILGVFTDTFENLMKPNWHRLGYLYQQIFKKTC